MWKFFDFEGKKIIRSKKNVIIALLLVGTVLGMIALNNQFNHPSLLLTGIQEDQRLHEEELRNARENLERTEEEDAIAWELENIERHERQLDLHRRQALAINQEDFLLYWTLEAERLEYFVLEGDEVLEFIQASLELGGQINQSIWMRNKAFSSETLGRTLSSIVFFFLVILLFGDVLTKDFENSSISLYSGLVKNKGRIVFIKFFIAFLLSIALFVGLFLLDNGVRWIVFGRGSFQNPIQYGMTTVFLAEGFPSQFAREMEKETILSTIGSFYLTFIGYYLIVVAFLLSCILALSAFMKKSLLVIGVLSFSYAVYYFAFDLDERLAIFMSQTPLHFLNIYDVITYSRVFYDANSLMIGSIYLSVLTVVLLVVAYLKMKYSKI